MPQGPAQLSASTLLNHHILVVDDEPANLMVMKCTLQSQFQVTCVESGEAALEVLAAQPVSVLLADQRMPGMSGVDLCEAVHSEYPEVERLILTAYGDSKILIDAINRGRVSRFLLKPWNAAELAFTLRETIWRIEIRSSLRSQREAGSGLDKVAAMKLGAVGVVHDMANTLQPLLLEAREQTQELDEAEPDLARLRLSNHRMLQGLEHLSALHHSLVPNGGRTSHELLLPLIDACLELVKADPRATFVELSSACAENLVVCGGAIHIKRVISNLVLNSVQALYEANRGGRVRVEVSVGSGDQVWLRTIDDGPGVAENMLSKLFAPGSTSREDQGGSGLGLAICAQLAASWGGALSLEYSSDGGTAFLVELSRSGKGGDHEDEDSA
jgi:signal transduction histidine kinase